LLGGHVTAVFQNYSECLHCPTIHPKLAKGGQWTDFAPRNHNWRREAKAPILILNAAALNTGHNWQFTASWMGEPPAGTDARIDANYRLRRAYYGDLPKGRRSIRLGHAVAPGLFHSGDVVVADIGLEPSDTKNRLVSLDILRLVPRKGLADNKYSAGSVLVVGGSPGMTGAICLTAAAAFRADAGYVTVAVPEPSLTVVEVRLLEPVKVTWADALAASAKAGAIAIGPGLGRTPEAMSLRDELLAAGEAPLVLDADALHELEPGDWGARAVLTPHAGELARLLGEESEWVNAHRLEAATRGAERFGCICLLKGADTIIAAPDEGPLVCVVDAPGLATAGTGDVLTGILAAFLAKGVEPRFAAAAAATAHGLSARASGRQVGMIASDVVAALPSVLS
jgi:NAD(P)H-hydrate epimerase